MHSVACPFDYTLRSRQQLLESEFRVQSDRGLGGGGLGDGASGDGGGGLGDGASGDGGGGDGASGDGGGGDGGSGVSLNSNCWRAARRYSCLAAELLPRAFHSQ